MILSQPGTALNVTLVDYLHLTKPRIAALLVFTACSAMIVAAGGFPPIPVVLGVIAGGWLAAGGASALNQYLERDLDARMARTRLRPIPSGRIPPVNALLFALALLILSFFVLFALVNLLAAVLAILGALYYVGIYTLVLKRSTAFNVVIGGGAGGFPVLVGWAAGAGNLELGAFLLFAIIFFWTPPHSWALALLIQGDYERGTVPMMPVVHGVKTTQLHIYWYTIHVIILTLLAYAAGMFGGIYLLSAAVLGIMLIWSASRLLMSYSKSGAKRLYKISSYYLLCLFLAMVVDTLIR